MSIQWDKVAMFSLAGFAMYELLKEKPVQDIDNRPIISERSPLYNGATPMTDFPKSNRLPHPIVSTGKVVRAGGHELHQAPALKLHSWDYGLVKNK